MTHDDDPRQDGAGATIDRGAAARRVVCPHCRDSVEAAPDAAAGGDRVCPSCGSAFRVDADATATWKGPKLRRLGRFELVEAIGSGGFGTVYRARDPRLDRDVAVKVPRAGSLAGPDDVDRFQREGRAVARLRHPAIVAVHEVGEADGVPFLVSDFVDGPSLADAQSGRTFSLRESAELVAVLADALEYAHASGVVHRDVKPSNVLFDRGGRPHLMDFGLARRDAGEVTVTQDGQILGTPAYMSPEQARGEAHGVDGRSDVYSLGVVLYQLLTGELPFRGNTRMLLHQVLNDEPRPPRKLNDRIPRDLETICLKAMAKEPARRFATAGELAAELRRWLDGDPIRSRPIGAAERAWRWCVRNRQVAALLGALAVAVAAGFAGITAALVRSEYHRGQAEKRRVEADNRRAEVEAQRLIAEENFDQALTAVDRFLAEMAETELTKVPGLEETRLGLQRSALAFYEGFVARRRGDTRLASRLGRAYHEMAHLQQALGDKAAAVASLQLAASTLGSALRERPDDVEALREFARLEAHEGEPVRAIGHWEKLVRERPDDPAMRAGLAEACTMAAGQAVQDKRPDAEVLGFLQKGLAAVEPDVRAEAADPDVLAEAVDLYDQCHSFFYEKKRYAEAEASARAGVDLATRLLERDPRSPASRLKRVRLMYARGSCLWMLGRREEALPAARSYLEEYGALAREHPLVPQYAANLHAAQQNTAFILNQMGQTEEANRLAAEARAFLESQPKRTPDEVVRYAALLSLSSGAAAERFQLGGDARDEAEAGRLAGEAVAQLRSLLDEGREIPSASLQGYTYFDAIRQRPDFRRVVADSAAVRRRAEAGPVAGLGGGGGNVAAAPAPADPRLAEAAAEQMRGSVDEGAGRVDSAAAALRRAVALREALAAEAPGDDARQADLARAHHALGNLMIRLLGPPHNREVWVEARRAFERAVAIREGLVARRPGDASRGGELAQAENDLGLLYARAGLPREAAAYVDRAVTRNPSLAPYGFQMLAACRLAAGDRAGALDACRRAQALTPTNQPEPAVSVLTTCGYAAGAPDAAAWRPAAEARFRSDTDPNTHRGLALLLADFRAGRDDEADRLLARWKPTWLEDSLNFGSVLVMLRDRLGRKEEARAGLAALDKAWEGHVRRLLEAPRIGAVPWGSEPIHWAEVVLFRRELDAAYGRPPARLEAQLRLVEARGYATLGLRAEGLERLRGLALPAGEPWMELAALRCRAELGDVAGTLARLDELARLRDGDAGTLFALGVLALRLDRPDRALACFRRSLEVYPADTGLIWEHAALAAHAIGRADLVRAVGLRALRVPGTHAEPAIRLNAIRAVAVPGYPVPDLAWLEGTREAAIRARPVDRMYASYLVGMAHDRAGRPDLAVERLAEAAALGEETNWEARPMTWIALALAEHHRGRDEEARRWLARATAEVDRRVGELRDVPTGHLPFNYPPHWYLFRILRARAEGEILYDPIFPADPFAKAGG